MRRLAITLACLLASAACLGPGDGECVNGAKRKSGKCVLTDDASSLDDGGEASPDASGPDGMTDGSIEPPDSAMGDDAGKPQPDGGGKGDASTPGCEASTECGVTAPLCTNKTCSACKANTDCSRFANMALAACGPAGSCVECTTNEHCLNPLKPVCGANNQCAAPCTGDLDCQRTDAAWTTPYCELGKGQCVGCTPGALEETQCANGNACDPIAMTCTGKTRGSVSGCGECLTDTECGTGNRCVLMTFGGAEHGSYCLQIAPSGLCPNQAPSKRQTTSVLGVTADFCFPRETLTTCEAVRDFGSSCMEDVDCGAVGLADGRCIGPNGAKRCTYSCLGDSDCGTLCIGTIGAKYCDPN